MKKARANHIGHSLAHAQIKFPQREYFEHRSEAYVSERGAASLNMGLINKVDMVCLSPVRYGV